jgi:hypothetical protein
MSLHTPVADGLAPYDCPDDGDDVTAASVNIGLHHLGNALEAIYPRTTVEIAPDAVRWYTDPAGPSPAFAALGTLNLVTSTQIDNQGAQLGYFYSKTVSVMNDAIVFVIPLDDLARFHGWSLTTAVLKVIGKAGHAALPANMPRIAVVRYGASATTGLLSTSWAVDASANTAAYQAEHNITFTADQNQTIDASQYRYAMLFQNEGNTNALNSLQARRIVLTMAAP